MRPMPQGRQPAKWNARWTFLLILLVSGLIISTVRVAADLWRADTTLTVQIPGQQDVQIDLNQDFAISPYLLGSNVFPRAGTDSLDQAKSGFMSYDQQVILGLRSANIKLLRFPGGNWGEQHIPSPEQLNDFSDLLNQVGAEGIMQVPLSDPQDTTPVSLQTRANRAALLVDYMNNRQSIQRTNAKGAFHSIPYWTIGNEPDLLINPDTQEKYTVKQYTDAFIAYSLAMHQKDPHIKIFGPEISQYLGKAGPNDASGKPWMEEFLTRISTYERTHALPFRLLDGVSFHRYPFDNAPKDTNALLNNSTEWNRVLPPLRQFIRQQFGEDLPIAITELNTNSGKGVPPQDLAAVWWADTLGQLMNNQVAYVTFFSTEGVDAPYPLFTQKDLKGTSMLHTMQLFAHLQSELVPIQGEQGPVSVYATQNQEHNTVSLLLINKSTDSQSGDVQAASILPFSPWHGTSLVIPAYGILVLTLHRGASNEAFSFNNTQTAQQDVPDIQHLVCGSNTGSIVVC